MKRTTHTYLTLLMAIMLFVMGNGTTLAHCEHSGQTWFLGFIDDTCEEESDCCDDEADSDDECVETFNLSLASVAASSDYSDICQIPVFSLLPDVQTVMPVYTASVPKAWEGDMVTICGPPRSVLFRHCILRL